MGVDSTGAGPREYVLLFKRADKCRQRILAAADELGLDYIWFSYERVLAAGLGMVAPVVGERTKLLPRGAYDFQAEVGYQRVVEKLMAKHRFERVADEQVWQAGFDRVEDKQWQADLFTRLGVNQAPMITVSTAGPVRYPVIVKRRLGALGWGNRVIRNRDEWRRLGWQRLTAGEYIVQEYFPLRADVRVLVLGGQVVGVVRREVREKAGGRLGVRVMEVAELPRRIKADCIRLADAMGAEMVGFDIGRKQAGEYFFIESNLSPFFLGFERVTGIDVARRWLEYYR